MLKVIVVEDEPAVRRELVLLTPWEELGFLFSGEACDGTEALALASRVKPDVVITDIRMPGMDGLALIGQLSSRAAASGEAAPECIVLSGFSEFEYARQALRMGVGEYLLKPVEDKDLATALARARDRVLERNAREVAAIAVPIFNEFREKGAGPSDSGAGGAAQSGNGSLAQRPVESHVSGAVRLIRERFISGITIEEAAAELGISSGHLSRIFKQETGYTFVDYLMYVRVKRAVELLRDPSVKVYEIADLVGYSDSRYFAHVFRKVTGSTPSEFREALLREGPSTARG